MTENLLKDSFPVLFEGLHTTGVLERCVEAKKKVLVRAHNIEHCYYHFLSKSESNLFRKFFFRSESIKLKRYEQILSHADHILGIAKHETEYFRNTYNNAVFIPAFHRFSDVTSLPGVGDYILFHGNLGVSENSDVFLKLARNVLSKINHPVVVAGKNPSGAFQRRVARYPHIRLIADPTDEEMDVLIQNAQVNLLKTSQSTGLKLKLLHSLFAGRHCLVNHEMIEGTGLEHLCVLADTNDSMIRTLDELMHSHFGENQIRERREVLQDYSIRAGAEKILRLIG